MHRFYLDKSFYDQNESFTKEAYQLRDQIDHEVRIIFFQWMCKGYYIREINDIIRGSMDKIQMEMFSYRIKR